MKELTSGMYDYDEDSVFAMAGLCDKRTCVILCTYFNTEAKERFNQSNRDNQLSDIFHKLSRMVVNKLVSNEIGNIIVGYNKGWKDSINIGRRNNQTFVQMSFDRFIEYLKYKCEMVGINLIIYEEATHPNVMHSREKK